WRLPRSRTASSSRQSATTRRCCRNRRRRRHGGRRSSSGLPMFPGGSPARNLLRAGQRRETGPVPERWPPAALAGGSAQMVEGLGARLKRDGRDLAGWQRLVNAYVVLGRKDDALSALADARKTFGGDEKALAELAALAKSLGLGS